MVYQSRFFVVLLRLRKVESCYLMQKERNYQKDIRIYQSIQARFEYPNLGKEELFWINGF